ncbi:MAG TPA: GNAT family N-acetyltransferase [Alphaproteobacteria bacterium]|nr:GNAT family N-acetyltransferase [Alphaproteobacteria bacterium]
MSDLALGRPAVASDAADLTVRLAADGAALAALLPEWVALAEFAAAPAFLLPLWIAAWWRHLGAAGGMRLRIATAWRGGRLVAVLPLAIRREAWGRRLQWAGTDVIDLPDALIHPAEDPGPCLDALWRAVRRGGGWDLADLSDVAPDGKAAAWAATRLRRHGAPAECYIFDLPEGSWLKAQGSLYKRGVPRAEKRLAAMGDVVLRRAETAEDAVRATAALAEQKAAWMAANGLDGALARPGAAAYLAEVATGLLARGLLELHWVECGGRIAAVVFGVRLGGTLGIYVQSYHRDFASAGAGKFMLGRLFEAARGAGFARVDMLRGDEAYKRELTEATVPLHRFVAGRGPWGLAAAVALRFGQTPGGRRLRAALRRAAAPAVPDPA